MALTLEWRRKLDNWHKVLRGLLYRPLGKVSLQGFTTLAQLKAGEALQHEFHPMPAGTAWGAKWEYGWFKGEVTLPPEAAGQRVVLRLEPGAESLVWINGKIAGGRDWAHPDLLLSKQGVPGETFTFLAESYAGHGTITVGGEPVPFGVETVPEPGATQVRVGDSSFGIWEEELFQLWVDVTTLYELREKLDQNSLRVAEIDQGLQDVTLIVDLELPHAELIAGALKGRERLKPLLAARNGDTMPVMYAFGHAHLDVAWLWPLQETERKMGRTISTALALMDEYPEYRYLQPQPHLFTMLRRCYPELYQRMLEKVKTGQFIPEGGSWVEPDTNITGGESLIRQFIHGKRFFRQEFGVECELFWEPDVFGYSGALPQIMRGCGMKYFGTQKIAWAYNGGDPFPYNQFIWEGIDGSEVMAHIFHGYGNLNSPAHLIQNWNDRLQKMDVSTTIYPYGWGDGGGGPDREHLEFARRVADLEGTPRLKHAAPMEFYRDLEARGLPKARYVGELYFQAHRGTYTSQARTKQGNRKSEWALREAECWGAAARALAEFDLPLAQLDEAWKKVLLNQFHDILPGSSIARVYEEANQMYAEVQATAGEITRKAAAALVKPAPALTVFNSLNWRRSILVNLPAGTNGSVDVNGRALPAQQIGDAGFVEVSVPACGWTTIIPHYADAEVVSSELQASPNSLENQYLKVTFNAAGEITSWLDKESGRELLTAAGNHFELFKDVPTHFDAWDLDSMVKDAPVALQQEGRLELVSAGPLVAILRLTRQLNNSQLEQEIMLRRNSRRLEFITTIDWQERHKLLKVAFPFAIHCNEGIQEIQFGHIRRPNHASRPFDFDRWEVCNHKWTAVCEEGRGAAVLNDCKYGVNVTGGTIHLTLLKSAMAPDMRADLGRQQFAYAACAWNGSLMTSPVVREAYEFNAPLSIIAGDGGERSLFDVDAPNIILETVKPAEDGSADIILRLYESKRTATRCALWTSLPVQRVLQTNMLEETENEIRFSGDKIHLDFRPFEIKTIRLKMG